MQVLHSISAVVLLATSDGPGVLCRSLSYLCPIYSRLVVSTFQRSYSSMPCVVRLTFITSFVPE